MIYGCLKLLRLLPLKHEAHTSSTGQSSNGLFGRLVSSEEARVLRTNYIATIIFGPLSYMCRPQIAS